MLRWVQALLFTLALAVLTFFTTGCGTSAQYRVVDAIADAPYAFDVDWDTVSTSTITFSDVTFGNDGGVYPSTGYQKISSGSHTIKVVETGQTAPVVISNSMSLGGSTQYTLVLMGKFNGTGNLAPVALQFTDDNTAPSSGNVEFRIIHASPRALNEAPNGIDVYIVPPGTALCNVPSTTFSGINYQAASPSYKSLAGSTTYSVIATPTGNCGFQMATLNYNPGSAGAITTMVLVDQQNGGNGNPQWLALTDVQ